MGCCGSERVLEKQKPSEPLKPLEPLEPLSEEVNEII